MVSDPRLKGYLWRGAVVVGVSVLLLGGWTGYRLWESWRSVDRFAFDPAEARVALEANPDTTTTMVDEDEVPPAPRPPADDDLTAVLIIGSDQRSMDVLSRRADVILVLLLPPGGHDPVLFSVPRDLYIANPCTGAKARVNVNLNGCGDLANGPETLAVAVENFIGIGIDHFILFTFDGFKAVVNRVGGVEICVDNPVRDLRTGLSLPAGCTNADGDQALAWVRSRRTQELVGGSWRTVPGVNDLARNERQQDLIIQALNRLKDFRDIGELAALAEDLAQQVLGILAKHRAELAPAKP